MRDVSINLKDFLDIVYLSDIDEAPNDLSMCVLFRAFGNDITRKDIEEYAEIYIDEDEDFYDADEDEYDCYRDEIIAKILQWQKEYGDRLNS
jgi:hypothetical protein